MKTLLYICAAAGIAAACISCRSTRAADPMPKVRHSALAAGDDAEFSSNSLIIMVDEKVGKEPLRRAVQEYGASIIYDYNIISGMAVVIPEGTHIDDATAYFVGVEGVISVEQDRLYHIDDGKKR